MVDSNASASCAERALDEQIKQKAAELSTALDAPFVLCEERDRLLHEYNNAVLEVSRSVGALADLAGIASGADYGLLSREKDRAKVRLKNARSAYEQHITEHGCGEPTAASE